MKTKTKTIITLGPKLLEKNFLEKIIKEGLDVARINFSHGDYQSNLKLYKKLKKSCGQKKISILQDLAGIKIRTGDFKKNEIFLERGKKIKITEKEVLGTEKEIQINFPNFISKVKIKEEIFLNDGKQKLEILKKNKNFLECRIVNGGKIRSKAGVFFSSFSPKIKSFTEKDKKDLEWGLKNIQPDYVALSFVKNSEDLKNLKKFLKERKFKGKIIAKIETKEAVKNFNQIKKECDIVMVARGDLALAVGFEKVPAIQKKLLQESKKVKKETIVATQLLSSMTNFPNPKRSEMNDIFNSVLDKASFLMLSEETSIGNFPFEAFLYLKKGIIEAEKF